MNRARIASAPATKTCKSHIFYSVPGIDAGGPRSHILHCKSLNSNPHQISSLLFQTGLAAG